MENNNEVHIEDPEYYDGWIAKYNLETGEVTLRDFYVTEKWSEEQKKAYCQELALAINKNKED